MKTVHLSEYTQTRANRLSKLSIPEIKEPFGLKILWIRWISFENSDELITRQKHKHSFYEAHFILTGNNEYAVNGEPDQIIESDSGIIISPNVSHKVKNISPELTKISIAFTPIISSPYFSKMEQNRSMTFKITDEISLELNAILKEAEKKDSLSSHLIANRILNIICSFIRIESSSQPEMTVSENKPDDVRVASAKQYVDDNKNLFLTCDDVARYCHFNTKYLNRIFKAQTGKTLLEYIHEVRITEAERLITETTLSLDEIASTLGFANEYYFNSFFKKYTTVSPGAYRKLFKNNQ